MARRKKKDERDNMEVISSLNNERVKLVSKLLKSPKERVYASLYVVEGIRMVKEIPDEYLDAIYFTQPFFNKFIMNNAALLRLVNVASQKGKCFVVTEPVLKKMTDTENPHGIVATLKMKAKDLNDLFGGFKKNEPPLILILEKIQDPGNMGTIIRTAEGAGVTGILVSYDSVDIYSPKVIRSTMGSIFRKNVVVTYDLIGDITRVKREGIEIFAMDLDGKPMFDANMTGPCAFLIGNEGNGLSEEIRNAADKTIRIPMEGQVESLNASVAACLVSYEARRQRKFQKEAITFL